jgi:lipoprotein-releasing system permease protein
MSNYRIEFFIAIRYLFYRSGEGFISLVSAFSFFGIMLGVATLIIVMSVMSGFREKLIDGMVGMNGHINIVSQSGEINNYQEIVNKIRPHDGVLDVVGLINGQALANVNDNNFGVLILGLPSIDVKKFGIDDDFESKLFSSSKKILVGKRFAENLNLEKSGFLNLISSKSISSVVGELPRMKDYEISGLFETGMYDVDANTVIMPLRQAQIFFQLYDSVNKIEIYLKSPYISTGVMDELREEFADTPDLVINDWQITNSHYLGALKSEKNVMFVILSLIILIAVFNIISSLVMMVMEKQRSIAILRSFGMTRGAIMRIFVFSGMLIATVSTIFGVGLGVVISENINSIKLFIENVFDVTLFDPGVYIFNEMPSKLVIKDVVYTVCLSTIVSFLAVIFPSYKASKIDPAKILRYL